MKRGKLPTIRQRVEEKRRQIESAAETDQREGFRFLDDAEIEKLPDPGWLIKGVLPEQALVVLYGKPGHEIGRAHV